MAISTCPCTVNHSVGEDKRGRVADSWKQKNKIANGTVGHGQSVGARSFPPLAHWHYTNNLIFLSHVMWNTPFAWIIIKIIVLSMWGVGSKIRYMDSMDKDCWTKPIISLMWKFNWRDFLASCIKASHSQSALTKLKQNLSWNRRCCLFLCLNYLINHSNRVIIFKFFGIQGQ